MHGKSRFRYPQSVAAFYRGDARLAPCSVDGVMGEHTVVALWGGCMKFLLVKLKQ